MANAERTKIVHDLMRGALSAARRVAPEVMVGKQCFIIDDDVHSLQAVKTELQIIGGDSLEISTARTSAAAAEICLEHGGRFDVVLIAHKRGSGEGDGIEVLARLHRAGLTGHAIVLLYADKLPRGVRTKARAAGFCEAVETDDIGASLLLLLARRLNGASDGKND